MPEMNRSISWIRIVRRRMMWIPLIPFVTAVIFWLVGTSLLDTAARLDREGVETQATVIERRIVQERNQDGSTRTAYRLWVEFNGAGIVIERSFDVRRATWDSAREGESLPLRYLPSEPTVSELERGSQRSGGRIFTAISFVCLLAALGLGAWLGRDLPALARARRRSVWRTARVFDHLHTRIRLNKTDLKRLSWQDETGALGQSLAHRPSQLPRIGEKITVLIDPETGQAWWDGDL